MSNIFQFGDTVKGYDVPVFNEREVRSAAGILFLFTIMTFMNAWLNGNFYPTKIFVILFLIDFIIRIFVNPNYAPTIILSKWIVRNQTVEYTGAAQKKFAWSLGLILSATMFYLVVLNNLVGPINLDICITSLVLLFFESVFGICIGCYIYNIFTKNTAHLCPGGICTPHRVERTQQTNVYQMGILIACIALIFTTPNMLQFINSARIILTRPAASQKEKSENDNCTPPEWAVSIGHAEMWKLHNNCL